MLPSARLPETSQQAGLIKQLEDKGAQLGMRGHQLAEQVDEVPPLRVPVKGCRLGSGLAARDRMRVSSERLKSAS
jgi:hypothetical protein